jgi:hypothetical protein
VLSGAVSTATGSPISLEVNNPVPAITGISPANFVAGASPATVSVAGTGFVPATVLQLNGSSRTTSYVDSTIVTVALTANDLSRAGNPALVAGIRLPGEAHPRLLRCRSSIRFPVESRSRRPPLRQARPQQYLFLSMEQISLPARLCRWTARYAPLRLQVQPSLASNLRWRTRLAPVYWLWMS